MVTKPLLIYPSMQSSSLAQHGPLPKHSSCSLTRLLLLAFSSSAVTQMTERLLILVSLQPHRSHYTASSEKHTRRYVVTVDMQLLFYLKIDIKKTMYCTDIINAVKKYQMLIT